MLRERTGDLFSSKDSLAHCVSANFRMNAGIAVEFVRRYGRPQKKGAVIGDVEIARDRNRYIFHLVTKEVHYGKPTEKTLVLALDTLAEKMKELKITKLSVPRLGCGLDQLKWEKVREILRNWAVKNGFTVTVYTLAQTPKDNPEYNAVKAYIDDPVYENWQKIDQKYKDYFSERLQTIFSKQFPNLTLAYISTAYLQPDFQVSIIVDGKEYDSVVVRTLIELLLAKPDDNGLLTKQDISLLSDITTKTADNHEGNEIYQNTTELREDPVLYQTAFQDMIGSKLTDPKVVRDLRGNLRVEIEAEVVRLFGESFSKSGLEYGGDGENLYVLEFLSDKDTKFPHDIGVHKIAKIFLENDGVSDLLMVTDENNRMLFTVDPTEIFEVRGLVRNLQKMRRAQVRSE